MLTDEASVMRKRNNRNATTNRPLLFHPEGFMAILTGPGQRAEGGG